MVAHRIMRAKTQGYLGQWTMCKARQCSMRRKVSTYRKYFKNCKLYFEDNPTQQKQKDDYLKEKDSALKYSHQQNIE